MSYAVKDKSISSGAPIECYEFIAPHKTWRYTSYHSPVQVAGEWYYPLQITRTAIEITSVIDTPATMDFNLPADHEICRQFCYTISPKSMVVIVRRVHEGDDYSTEFKIEWTGRYSGARGSGKWGTIKTASILQTELNGFLSSVYYQKSCNHVLYDVRCKAVKEDFTEEATVVKIQSQIITVDDQVFADDDLVGGVMVNTRTGEQQGIISNQTNVIRIGYPFFDLLVGDTVELTLGCDHQRLGHCKDRFNNTENYGGFDFIPEINPFEKLVYTSATQTETSAQGNIAFKMQIPAVSGRQTGGGGGRRSSSGTSLMPNFSPKPRPTSQRTSDFGSSTSEGTGNIPQAVLGMAVSAVLGRKRVANHNLIWTGNLRPITQTVTAVETWTEEVDQGGGFIEKITYTETTYTTTTIGYYCDIHLGICLGPDVHLIGIYVDGSPIWTGDVGPDRTEITLPENDTFLSNSKVYFCGGQFDQAPEPLIDVPDYPGHVGIATALLKDVRADLNMSQVSFEVVRIPNPLGLSSGDNRIGDDLNIVSALIEVITNEWGYGGLDINNVDTAQFSSMAVIVKDEGNICSIKIDNDVGVNEVIGAIQDQGRMVVFEDPETGLITGQLVRPIFDYVNMPRFHTGNIIEMRNFEKGGWQDTLEQARGLYTERDAEYNEVPVFAQNAANISQSGRGKRTVTLSYPFVPNKTLASTLLFRDLAGLAAPNYGFSILTNRDGAVLKPGDIISVTWPDHSLLNLPMQVISIRKQDINYNNVVVNLRQIKYPDTQSLFGTGGPTYDPGFNVNPVTPTGAAIITAPYYMARARNGISSVEVNPLNFPLFLPRAANSFQGSFDAYIDNLPGSLNPVRTVDRAGYPAYGQLTASISVYDGFDTGELASITIDNVINPSVFTNIGEDGVRAGRLFLIVGNEIMSFESATDLGGGAWQLDNVHRGLLDTVAQSHADNANVYVMSNNFSNVSRNGFSHPVGYTPDWLIVSNGIIVPGRLEDAFATSAWSPTGMRTLAPPRPHNTKVDGNTRSSTPVDVTEGASVTVTWSTRSRLSADVKLQLDAAETAEANAGQTQKHRVYHRTPGGTYTDIGGMAYTGNTATFTMPNVTDGAGTFVVRSEMILGGIGYQSLFEDRVPVNIIP